MDNLEDSRVFVIDDDGAVLTAVARLLRVHGLQVEAFSSPDLFLSRPSYDGVACVLLDLYMPGVSGLDVQEALVARASWIPIIFLSGYGDVPVAARAMRKGAVDFLVKPFDETELLDAVTRALARSGELLAQSRRARDTSERLSRLTKRERQVCELVAQGLLNKQIAYELGTSEKTIKVHRGRVMHKLEVDSVAALVRLLATR